MDYLHTALNLLRTKAYFSQKLDLDEITRRANVLVGTAQTPIECYPAIQMAITALADNHSFFIGANEKLDRGPQGKPLGFGLHILYPELVVIEVFPDSPADKGGIRTGDVVELLDNHPPGPTEARKLNLTSKESLHLKLRRNGFFFETTLHAAPISKAPWPHGYLLGDKIGYLELFVQGPAEQIQDYIDITQQIIRDVSAAGAQAWVVDLRSNRGGNMWPMITGAGPLMGEGKLGQFVNADQSVGTQWFYQAGATSYRDPEMSESKVYLQASNPVVTLDPHTIPIAILTSEFTGSSGEMTLISFLGRPNTRSFGEKTIGQITAVGMYDLEDGAILGIAESLAADRTNQVYPEAIIPDEILPIDWYRYGQADDPLIVAAIQWLQTQTAKIMEEK